MTTRRERTQGEIVTRSLVEEAKMERLLPGTKVVTAHGRHSGHETGTIVRYQFSEDVREAGQSIGVRQDWYSVKLDCDPSECDGCELSLDVRSDGYGRIITAK